MSGAVILLIATLVIYFCSYVCQGLGYNLQFGMTGVANLAIIVSMAAGAYVSAVLRMGPPNGLQQYPFGANTPFPLSILGGVVAGAAFGLLLGAVFVPRLKPEFFIVVTVVIADGLVTLVSDVNAAFGGSGGLYDIPAPLLHTVAPSPEGELLLAAVAATAAVLVTVLMLNLERSPVARRFRAVRESEFGANSAGISPNYYRILSLVLGGGLAGLGGALLVLATSAWGPDAWQIPEAIVLLSIVVVGGAGNVFGVIIGVLVVEIGFGQALLYVPAIAANPVVSANLEFVIAGVLQIAVFWWFPRGILPERRPRAPAVPAVAAAPAHPSGPGQVTGGLARLHLDGSTAGGRAARAARGEPAPVLVVEAVTAHYGQMRVLSDVSLGIPPGVTCLLGPNGAGKSTLIDVISGYLKPATGRVLLHGTPLRGSPHRRACAGLGRMFQLPQEFAGMTVFENVAAAAARGHEASLVRGMAGPWAWRGGEARVASRVWPVLEVCGLANAANQLAGQLSGGQKKLLELARSLAGDPEVLLLDEPFAGVAPHLQDGLLAVLEELKVRGLTLVLVEHEMRLVEQISTEVVVMDMGAVIAQGPFQQIRQVASVQEALLGGSAAG